MYPIAIIYLVFSLICTGAHCQDFEGIIKYKFECIDISGNENLVKVMKIIQPEYLKISMNSNNIKKQNYFDSAYKKPESSYYVVWKKNKMYSINKVEKEILASTNISDINNAEQLPWPLPNFKEVLGHQCQLFTHKDLNFTYSYWVSKQLSTSLADGFGLVLKNIGIVLELVVEGKDFSFSFKAKDILSTTLPNKEFNLPYNYEIININMQQKSVFSELSKISPESWLDSIPKR